MKEKHRPHILIVEDNLDTIKLLDYQLRAYFQITLAMRIDEALQLADRHRFDLFLLDINLGERRTGIDLLERLRQHAEHRNTPAIALTAYALPGDRERFLEEGFEAYVSKPFLRDDLINTIRHVLAATA
ncbi:response regulator [Rhodocaloribacter litoris]|uniref:response regulator n=1 Tax=Rhodocaloribacter litoris TaxID=2558931 RepID=UPI001423A919|nr:response regulator [Rhodocaloribacter litoris]QXD14684.1 response regulator [Rhodocaloribacter litoris]GIV59229.1 MAG: hypothetical protein KatS3mg043_0318 [Rhodothermaceae bacterium]